MARNEEKQYGRLNRLILGKEKAEYEKNNPKRPRLDALLTAEEIQKWLPSIKKDLDFYLKKSMVICYSDEQIKDCRIKVNQLESEYKAFVRKLKQLTPGNQDAVPWTNRPYKRKSSDPFDEGPDNKTFVPIPTPILNKECVKPTHSTRTFPINLPLMNDPLSFETKLLNEHSSHICETLLPNESRISIQLDETISGDCKIFTNSKLFKDDSVHNGSKQVVSIVNYSSDSDS